MKASRRLPDSATRALLVGVAAACAWAAAAVAEENTLAERFLGSARFAITGAAAVAAVCALGFAAANGAAAVRVRSRASAAHARLPSYALAAMLAAQVAFIDHYHSDLFPAMAAAAAATFPAALWIAARRDPEAPPRVWLRALDFAAANAALFLILGEVSLRCLARASDAPLLATSAARSNDFVRRFRFAPGRNHLGFACNSLGFYDAEFRAKAAGDARTLIASIGDSFAASAVPHHLHFTTVAESLLPDTTVANIGVAGASGWDYLHFAEAYALPLRPDLIVVAVFAGNDFIESSVPIDSGAPWYWMHRENTLVVAVPTRLWRLLQERAAEISRPAPADPHAEGALTAKRGEWIEPIEDVERARPFLRDPMLEPPSFTRERFLEIERHRARLNCIKGAVNMQGLCVALQELKAVAGETPVAVMIIPDEYQVEDGLWSEVVAAIPEASLDRDLPQRYLKHWLEGRGIPYVDLLPRLRAVGPLADGNRHLYLLQDTHFNARGNREAAVAMAELARRVLGNIK